MLVSYTGVCEFAVLRRARLSALEQNRAKHVFIDAKTKGKTEGSRPSFFVVYSAVSIDLKHGRCVPYTLSQRQTHRIDCCCRNKADVRLYWQNYASTSPQ